MNTLRENGCFLQEKKDVFRLLKRKSSSKKENKSSLTGSPLWEGTITTKNREGRIVIVTLWRHGCGVHCCPVFSWDDFTIRHNVGVTRYCASLRYSRLPSKNLAFWSANNLFYRLWKMFSPGCRSHERWFLSEFSKYEVRSGHTIVCKCYRGHCLYCDLEN